MTTEENWKILKGEIPIQEAMKMYGLDEKEIDKIMDEVGQYPIQDALSYFEVSRICAIRAYNNLVDDEVIDPKLIWNMASKKYSHADSDSYGDFGLSGKKRLIYMATGWKMI